MMSCKNKQIVGNNDCALLIIVAMNFIKACKGLKIQNIVKNNVSRLFDKRDFINNFLDDENMTEEQIFKLFTRTFVYSRADLRVVELVAAANYTSLKEDKTFTKSVVDKITRAFLTETRKIVKSQHNNNSRYISKFCENMKFFVEFMEVAEMSSDVSISKKWNGVICDIVKIFNKKISRHECPRQQFLNSECQGNLHNQCQGIPHSYNCPLKATKQCKGEDCEGIKCSVFIFHVEKYIDSRLFSIEKD